MLYADIREWAYFPVAIRRLGTATSRLQDQYLQDIVDAFMSAIKNRIEIRNLAYTGTYQESLVGRVVNRQQAVIGLEPKGIASEALPIYWKVLEFGSKPIPNLPREPIEDWATTKLGVTYAVARRIWKAIKRKGVKSHPILSDLFVIDPATGYAQDLTPVGRGILRDVLEQFGDRMVQATKLEMVTFRQGPLSGRAFPRGPRIPRGMPGAGRWTAIPTGSKGR